MRRGREEQHDKCQEQKCSSHDVDRQTRPTQAEPRRRKWLSFHPLIDNACDCDEVGGCQSSSDERGDDEEWDGGANDDEGDKNSEDEGYNNCV
jgi:hypothetical protein